MTQRVRQAVMLLAYLNKMDKVFVTLDLYNMSCRESAEITELKKLHARLITAKDSMTLKDVGTHLESMQKALGGLKPEHFSFFEQAFKARELVIFLDTFSSATDFRERAQLLTSQLQGQEFLTNIITDLQVAYSFLDIFLDKKSEFKKLVEHVKKQSTGKNLVAIDTAVENITTIRLRFDQLRDGTKGIIPRIEDFMKTGRFVSHSLSCLVSGVLTFHSPRIDLRAPFLPVLNFLCTTTWNHQRAAISMTDSRTMRSTT